MELSNEFATFLAEIRPTDKQKADLQRGHITLRERLDDDQELKKIIITNFLQGSYRRATAVRPKDDKRSDVDIVVVTKLSEKEYSPAEAMRVFVPFLKKHYNGKWKAQGRSFGIELSYVDLDLVITSAPSESEYGILQSSAVASDDSLEEARDWKLHSSWIALAERNRVDARSLLAEAKRGEEWKLSPLRIPDREANSWQRTHPLEQIRWTAAKNNNTNGHFINIVKAIKWWRLENYKEPKHPKGFPLERLIGECCPDATSSVAEGIVDVLETIVSKYHDTFINGTKPRLPDYGVPEHDVFSRVQAGEFKLFYEQTCGAAIIARKALNSSDRKESGTLWRSLFGSKFPVSSNDGGSEKEGFVEPKAPAAPNESGRFA